MNFKSFLKFFVLIALLIVVGVFSYRAGIIIGEDNLRQVPPEFISNPDGQILTGQKPAHVDFSLFWEVWHRVEEKFLMQDEIDHQKMVLGAIKGMVDSLGDPYTSFFSPSENKSFEEDLNGQYEGVGMYVGVKDGQITVVSPLKNSPAEQAGIKPEDKILKIEDTYTADLTIDQAVQLIKGKRGTFVKLLIQREGWLEPKEFSLKRETITIPTLEWETLPGGIALIKIYQFNEILPKEFNEAGIAIIKQKNKKIILDLRNNPGGYLEVAQIVAGWFVPSGKVVVWQKQGEAGQKKAYNSSGPALLSDYQIIVLINGGSASAAEILAGCLRDQLGVKLVGEKSFGKGLVQDKLNLSDGSSLKVTVAEWLTPNGDYINKTGLEPDVVVEMAEEVDDSQKDAQLEKAIEILQDIK